MVELEIHRASSGDGKTHRKWGWVEPRRTASNFDEVSVLKEKLVALVMDLKNPWPTSKQLKEGLQECVAVTAHLVFHTYMGASRQATACVHYSSACELERRVVAVSFLPARSSHISLVAILNQKCTKRGILENVIQPS